MFCAKEFRFFGGRDSLEFRLVIVSQIICGNYLVCHRGLAVVCTAPSHDVYLHCSILLVLVLVELFGKSKLFELHPSRTNNNRWVGRTCFTYTMYSIQYDFVASSIPTSFALSIESGRVSESHFVEPLCRECFYCSNVTLIGFLMCHFVFSLSVSKVADRVFLFFNFPYRLCSKSDSTQRRQTHALEIWESARQNFVCS